MVFTNFQTVSISEGTSILHKAEKLFKGVESSCRNGVCTTCAGKVSLFSIFNIHVYYIIKAFISFLFVWYRIVLFGWLIHWLIDSWIHWKIEEGKPSTLLGVHGLGEPQVNAGFICTCQCYVTGPGVVIRLDQFDEVYESQYGQFEKSYGELKYSTK